MKRIEYILFAAVLLFTSCEKEQLPFDYSQLPVHRGYMQFSTGVSTRTQLATDMYDKSFGVLAYKYSATSNWRTSKSTATPNLFYDQKVACAGNGVCTYDINSQETGNQLKQWEDNHYAFFAYHPYQGQGIELSSKQKTNTPTLTYQYGWLNPTNQDDWFEDNTIDACHNDVPIFDLMTAENIDASGSGQGKVNLDFKHRLCAIEVLANNYNEHEFEYEKDTDGNPILDANGKKIYKLDAEGKKIIAKNARQQITNLTLTLKGLRHTAMTIPLSMDESEPAPTYVGDIKNNESRYL